MIHYRERSGRLLRWLHPNGMIWGGNPGHLDPDLVMRTIHQVDRFFGPGCYFGLEVDGWENVPDAPAMVVSNHSGGTTIPDAWGFAVAWYRKFGKARPIHPMAHEMVFSLPPVARYFAKRGALRGDRRIGYEVLRGWKRDLMVMPGGDRDTWRPYSKRFEVCFGGRTGYARLALKAGVPILPVANAGAHETLYVLTDGRRMAEALGLPKLARASIFPVHVSLPWGLTVGPWPHIPLPANLRYKFGPAIAPPDEIEPGREPTDEQVLALDAEVRSAVQKLLDDLRG